LPFIFPGKCPKKDEKTRRCPEMVQKKCTFFTFPPGQGVHFWAKSGHFSSKITFFRLFRKGAFFLIKKALFFALFGRFGEKGPFLGNP
jgi:hypothetical protein